MMNDKLFNFLSSKFEFLGPKNWADEVSNFEKKIFDEIRLIYFYKIWQILHKKSLKLTNFFSQKILSHCTLIFATLKQLCQEGV